MTNYKYDLEKRTYDFALEVRKTILEMPKSIVAWEDGKQVIRSSGSIGANYIEANEKLGEKDFIHKLRIARKEAKETIYWLKLIQSSLNVDLAELIDEADQLKRILSSIILKSSKQ